MSSRETSGYIPLRSRNVLMAQRPDTDEVHITTVYSTTIPRADSLRTTRVLWSPQYSSEGYIEFRVVPPGSISIRSGTWTTLEVVCAYLSLRAMLTPTEPAKACERDIDIHM